MARLRVAVVCAGVVVLGSPWVGRPLLERIPQGTVTSWVQNALATPLWLTPAWESKEFGAVVQWSMVASIAPLLIGLLVVMPGLMTRTPAGWGRWGRAIGAGALIGALSGLLSWGVLTGFGHNLGSSNEHLFGVYVPPSAAFGALLGVVIGLLFAKDGSSAPAVRRRRVGPQERSTGIDTMADSSPAALGEVDGDVTRYLCAAAYLDPAFARSVVEDLLADPFGAIAASPGVDLLPVARHCLTARELRHRRDLGLAAVYGCVLLIAPLWLVLGGLALSVLGGRVTDGSRRRGYPGQADRGRGGLDVTVSNRRVVITLVLLVAVGLLFGIELSALHLPGLFQWLLGGYAFGLPPLLVLGAGLVAAQRLVEQEELDTDERLRTTLRRPDFQPESVPQPAPSAPWIEDRLEALAEAQRGNVTVYSGWSPFMGFAAPDSTWSLSIPLLPATHPLGSEHGPGTMTGFDAWELIERIRLCWTELSAGRPTRAEGEPLTGLVVRDRVFVHGATIGGDPRFVSEPGSVLTTLEPDQVRQIALDPTGSARHWLTGCLSLWGGDVVPSLLLNVSVSGQTVHVRCGAHVLGTVRGRYHAVDTLPATLTAERRGALRLAALRRTRALLLAAPFAVLGHVGFESRRRKRLLREWRAIENDPGFDYGARFSVRESALNPTYPNYYQPQDGARVLNTLNRHTLAALRDFLEAHGVDTTDFNQQQQTILNHGVIQQGGVSTIENLAVGQGASVSAPGAATPESAPSR